VMHPMVPMTLLAILGIRNSDIAIAVVIIVVVVALVLLMRRRGGRRLGPGVRGAPDGLAAGPKRLLLPSW
jgi:hypothetical protein